VIRPHELASIFLQTNFLQTMENNNSILQLNLYKKDNTWAFDDDNYGIVNEPFVLGMSEIISHYAPDRTTCTIIFSLNQFPNSNQLVLLEEEHNGGWYFDTKSKMQGWLCPVTRIYLNNIPQNIYYSVN